MFSLEVADKAKFHFSLNEVQQKFSLATPYVVCPIPVISVQNGFVTFKIYKLTAIKQPCSTESAWILDVQFELSI